MAGQAVADKLRSLPASLDPRRSLAAAAMWLIIALTLTFSIAAAVWVGRIAGENVVQQHVRRLSLETDQLSSDLGQALAARLDAVRAAGPMLRAAHALGPSSLGQVFEQLVAAYPQLDWIAIADLNGGVVASNGAYRAADNVATRAWFASGLQGLWLGVITAAASQPLPAANVATLGDMAIPVREESGRVVGVIAAHLSWRRTAQHPERLTDDPDPRAAAEAYVLDRDGIVLVGPADLRNRRWNGIAVNDPLLGAAPESTPGILAAPQFERLPDGRRVLVSRSLLSAVGEITALGWQVQLCEPNERVFQRAKALALRILWVSMCLGAATAVLGILGARHLTRRLKRLTESVARVGESDAATIEIPGGVDEVAQLGAAFAKILGDLQQERSELERRVAVRTREVQRLAEESRYAAIVRERLKIARDLHDTLAHSMMAMLSEIRFLRRLQSRDPGAVAAELVRAQKLAHEGLQEARSAITQMRVTAVRETGLGPALANEFERFINRTGLTGDFSADVAAARFGDERAETILRMAQEALRNVERHARATRVVVRLQSRDNARLELCIEDNGVGFDPKAQRPGHYGIVGLREQAELIGAELFIDSRPNQGTNLRVSLRLSPIVFTPADTTLPA
ncbi:MAG TPA: histidine kinase [Steroidobacteraceae bacterium]|nr:histidine kinase [Steroidobacteraceae bacterium]